MNSSKLLNTQIRHNHTKHSLGLIFHEFLKCGMLTEHVSVWGSRFELLTVTKSDMHNFYSWYYFATALTPDML